MFFRDYFDLESTLNNLRRNLAGPDMVLPVSYNFTRAGIAQLVEQLICNQKVAGSIPAAGTKCASHRFRFADVLDFGCKCTNRKLASFATSNRHGDMLK